MSSESYKYWQEYRRNLTKILKEQSDEIKLQKTPEEIVKMALKEGIKPTARYFGINPSSVRYYIRKQKKD